MRAAQRFDVVVVGAGAAGLFCAATAGARGKRVLLLDHADKPGAKILISGGGRCNFTNLDVRAPHFISNNPHFCKSALAGFAAQDFVALVRAAGIKFHEKKLGQLFCDGSAREILALLLGRCEAVGVEMRLGQQVSAVTKPGEFELQTSAGVVSAPALVLATGGLSIPKLGASGFAHEVARRFGLGLTQIRPGLVPLTFAGEAWGWMQGLSGVALDVEASGGGPAFAEAALFTHRGLSGPAVLQVSSYWREGQAVRLNLLPGQDAFEVLRAAKAARPKAELRTVLAALMPARLAAHVAGAESRPMAELPNAVLRKLAAGLQEMVLLPAGTEGFAKAEVTLGGVDTASLSSKTMGALEVPGLFVIGEAVDVTGWLGGYNFQWAWSSGHAAGMAV